MIRINNNAPEEITGFLLEIHVFREFSEAWEGVKLLHAKFGGRRLSDLVKKICNMLRLQVEGRFVDNLEDLTLVVALAEVPELLQ